MFLDSGRKPYCREGTHADTGRTCRLDPQGPGFEPATFLPFYPSNLQRSLCPAGYYVASALCFAALFRASTADPGRLLTDPHIPQSGVETGSASSLNLVKVSSRAVRVLTDCCCLPAAERQHWELCNKCNLMRPKRSHHCSRCGHCVRKMDHHCPW